MKKEEMLKMLLDDLHSMSGEQLVRDYKEKRINIVDYNSDKKGEVCLHDYHEG